VNEIGVIKVELTPYSSPVPKGRRAAGTLLVAYLALSRLLGSPRERKEKNQSQEGRFAGLRVFGSVW